MSDKGLVLTWGRMVRRSLSLAGCLNAHEVHLQPRFSNKYLKVFNYMASFYDTLRVCKGGYEYVILVMPPVFSLYAVLLYISVSKSDMKIVVDMHNGMLRSEWRNWPFFNYLLSKVDVVISHNAVVKKAIDEQFNVDSFVLTDPVMNPEDILRDVPNTDAYLREGLINVIVPLSYADDEPIDQVVGAAQKLKGKVNFVFTGRPKGKYLHSNLSEIVTLTGYVEDDVFYQLMRDSDLVLCLTHNTDIQMCALIESISLKKKFICSNNDVNRLYFKDFSFALVENDEEAIFKALDNCDIQSIGDARYGVDESLKKYESYWKGCIDGLRI